MTDDKKPLHPVDVHVGMKLREKRIELNLSQNELANVVNLTFQQIQKYERGINRIGASNLYKLAVFLNVSVTYFFNGLDVNYEFNLISNNLNLAEKTQNYNFDTETDVRELVEAFLSIKDSKIRNGILNLAKSLQ